ncbi:hypothetical protein EVAR_91222_1 [Eumeta japonica]|uniref:Uncharacterized protein n=1 Tax=Eumeta variegata TaxID=151549 RepID=A0A4C2A6J7_EUMVA|nr:hypothetical protein EVAR_91222_1 [Eumeta japonica]
MTPNTIGSSSFASRLKKVIEVVVRITNATRNDMRRAVIWRSGGDGYRAFVERAAFSRAARRRVSTRTMRVQTRRSRRKVMRMRR